MTLPEGSPPVAGVFGLAATGEVRLYGCILLRKGVIQS